MTTRVAALLVALIVGGCANPAKSMHLLDYAHWNYIPTRPELPPPMALTPREELAAVDTAFDRGDLVESLYYADLFATRSFRLRGVAPIESSDPIEVRKRVIEHLEAGAGQLALASPGTRRSFGGVVRVPPDDRTRGHVAPPSTWPSLGYAYRPLETDRRACALSAIQALLLPSELLLLYAPTLSDRALVFCVTSSELVAVELGVPLSDIQRYVAILRSRLAAGPSGGERGLVESQLEALGTILLGPVRAALEAHDTLIVVPGASLDGLPFHALIRRDADGRQHSLLEDHVVTYAPCLRAFVGMKGRPLRRPEFKVLCVGDPVPPAAWRSVAALPSAKAEAYVLGKVYDNATVLLGASATEGRVLASARGHDVLHFACHGLALDRDPTRSFLLLADGEGSDGLLTLREVLSMPLSARLVTLSACETAVSAPISDGTAQPEVRTSLATAFLAAGADSVVASLWQVDSDSTALLMLELYRHLGEIGPASALRNAALRLKGMPEYSDPYYWAAFSCYGDPR